MRLWRNSMNCRPSFRLAMTTLIPFAAIALGLGSALAQAPSASPAPTVTATPAPEPSASPAPMASPSAAPPAAAEAPVQTADPFGEEITLAPKTVVVLKGNANWDSAFDALIDSFKSLSALLDKQGIKPSGNAMIVYTSTDDTGFTFQAEVPVDQEP